MPTDEFEEYVAKELSKIDNKARATICSGSKLGDEDVKSGEFLIQCKRSTIKKNFIIDYKDWLQLMSAMLKHRKADGNYRTPVFMSQNADNYRIASMEFADWIGIIRELYELRVKALKFDNLTTILEKVYNKTVDEFMTYN